MPCLLVGVSSAVFFRSPQGLVTGVLLGLALFVVNLASDLIISKALRDRIFDLRRTAVLSLFCWGVWFFFSLLGTVLGVFFGFGTWVKLCLLGLGIIISFRTVVFLSVSLAPLGLRLAAILLQPIACIIPFVLFWNSHGVAALSYVPFIVVAPFLTVGAAYLFIRQLDNIGKKTYNIPGIAIFKTFLLNWVTSENAPLETYLEQMGEDADVEVSILKFDAEKPKAAFVMPLVHPGPFKNIGSSLLPSLMKQAYEKRFGCDACIPLVCWLRTRHRFTAANYKIINQTLASANTTPQSPTPHLHHRNRRHRFRFLPSFGKTAFLSFTLAPKPPRICLRTGHNCPRRSRQTWLRSFGG